MASRDAFDNTGYQRITLNLDGHIDYVGSSTNNAFASFLGDVVSEGQLTSDDSNGLGHYYFGSIMHNDTQYPITVSRSQEYFLNIPEGVPALPVGEVNPPLIVSTAAMPLCFVGGTTIDMFSSDSVQVERLQPSDVIRTAQGAAEVLWIGRQVKSTLFGIAERLMPVRLARGSLGDNLPNEDLTVSNDHAFLVDGILATAGALVNGTSIYRVPLDEFEDGTITYYHIETENHEIIYANGAPAETFIDNVSRQVFDNYQEYVDLYGEEREMDELPLPRAMSPRQLPKTIKARLAARAIELGYAEKAVA